MGLRVVLMLVETFGELGPALVEELRKASPVQTVSVLVHKTLRYLGQGSGKVGWGMFGCARPEL